MMKYAVFVVVFFILGMGCFAQGSPPRVGAYPIYLFTDNPLTVGTPVWANVGDNECAYNKNHHWPNGERYCFEKKGKYPSDYQKARIKSIELTRVWGDKYAYTYTIEFVEIPFTRGERLTRKAFFDEAMRFYNLPADLADYSIYFVRLNW